MQQKTVEQTGTEGEEKKKLVSLSPNNQRTDMRGHKEVALPKRLSRLEQTIWNHSSSATEDGRTDGIKAEGDEKKKIVCPFSKLFSVFQAWFTSTVCMVERMLYQVIE